MEENEPSTIQEYLTFRIAEENYAINVGSIKEVLGVPRITRVPRMPEYMSGVINLRGSVIPVLDLRMKFGLGETLVTDDTGVIVTEVCDIFEEDEGEKLIIGIFSDVVQKVVTIADSEIEPPPKIGMAIETDFIAGIGRVDDSFVIILNIDKVLSGGEMTPDLEGSLVESQ